MVNDFRTNLILNTLQQLPALDIAVIWQFVVTSDTDMANINTVFCMLAACLSCPNSSGTTDGHHR
jgi:hypothetical protein